MHGSWYIGTVVGHQLAWLRNSSPGARGVTWPGELGGGWEYRAGYTGDWRVDTSLGVTGLPGNAETETLHPIRDIFIQMLRGFVTCCTRRDQPRLSSHRTIHIRVRTFNKEHVS